MVTFIIGLVIGFIAGALVFRNNATKAEALVKKAQEEAKSVIAKVKNK
jgi:F0F1-type ATP synthase assembly protein I